MQITVRKSPTADTRTCDWSKVTKQDLHAASISHMLDVAQAMAACARMLLEIGARHDLDKITALEAFHADFRTGFKQTEWWDNHRKVNRHHLNKPDGVPVDVDLFDVLEHIVDCVVAGMARSGEVYALELPDDVLRRAFENTVAWLIDKVTVEAPERVESEPVKPAKSSRRVRRDRNFRCCVCGFLCHPSNYEGALDTITGNPICKACEATL